MQSSRLITGKKLADRLVTAIENAVASVPPAATSKVQYPAGAATALARKAAARAATISGTLALPPGPFGLITVLPDLVAIWRIQAQMVSDLAGLFGRELDLTRSHMMYCLFRHAATQAIRDVAMRGGERILVEHWTRSALKGVATGVGMHLTKRMTGEAAARWLPLIGAAAVAGYAYYDTMQVAKTAIDMLNSPTMSENLDRDSS